jgi:hypothetical protein
LITINDVHIIKDSSQRWKMFEDFCDGENVIDTFSVHDSYGRLQDKYTVLLISINSAVKLSRVTKAVPGPKLVTFHRKSGQPSKTSIFLALWGAPSSCNNKWPNVFDWPAPNFWPISYRSHP